MQLSLYSASVYVATSASDHKIVPHITDRRQCAKFEVVTAVLPNVQAVWYVTLSLGVTFLTFQSIMVPLSSVSVCN